MHLFAVFLAVSMTASPLPQPESGCDTAETLRYNDLSYTLPPDVEQVTKQATNTSEQTHANLTAILLIPVTLRTMIYNYRN